MRRKRRGADDELADMIETPHDQMGKVPGLPRSIDKVVRTAFDVDVEGDSEDLLENLQTEDALNPQAIRSDLNRVEARMIKAHQIYLTAKYEADSFQDRAAKIEASMRSAATLELEADKRAGNRTKAITDADVEKKIAAMFPDQFVDLRDRRRKAAAAVEHLKHLSKAWESRARSLKSLNETV